jgi:hypothetical protein
LKVTKGAAPRVKKTGSKTSQNQRPWSLTLGSHRNLNPHPKKTGVGHPESKAKVKGKGKKKSKAKSKQKQIKDKNKLKTTAKRAESVMRRSNAAAGRGR